jgi:hypothetical protein
LTLVATLTAAVVWVSPAAALSEALARKCHALTMQEYPRPKWVAYKPGNPAMARLREAYYRDCLAKDGNIAAAVPPAATADAKPKASDPRLAEPKPAEPKPAGPK